MNRCLTNVRHRNKFLVKLRLWIKRVRADDEQSGADGGDGVGRIDISRISVRLHDHTERTGHNKRLRLCVRVEQRGNVICQVRIKGRGKRRGSIRRQVDCRRRVRQKEVQRVRCRRGSRATRRRFNRHNQVRCLTIGQ